MRLIVDLDSRKFTTGTGFVSNLPPVVLKRGDEVPVEVRFLQGGVPVLLGTPFDLRLGFRAEGAEWGERVGLATGFTAPGDAATGYYEAVLDLNTAEANTALGVGTENELASVRVYGEVTWSLDSGSTWISTENRIATLYNDVNRTEEGTPLSLETPVEWLDSQNELRGIQPIRSGASHLFSTSMTISGTILDSAGDPIALSALPFLAITQDAPQYEVDDGTNTFGIFYDGAGTWTVEVDGPDNIIFTVTDSRQDPTALVLTPLSGHHASQGSITIVATDGTEAPRLGDRGYITGEKLFYNWTGNRWELELNPFYHVIVVDGDSRSAEDATGAWSTMIQSIPPFTAAQFEIVAASGARTWERIADYATDVTPHAPGPGKRGLYLCYLGVNDVFQVGGVNVPTVRDIYENLKTLWANARGDGFEVVAFTLQQHSFAAAGIAEPEQRQVQLNKLILSDPSFYDFLIPLHELLPDETVYGIGGVGQNFIHNNTAGNQFIADNVARILGANDRTRNVPPQAMTKATGAEFRINSVLGSAFNVFHEYNLALSSDATAPIGTVTDSLGFRRLSTGVTSGSQAAMQFAWPLTNSSNNIAWSSSRFRGIVTDLRMATLNSDQIISISAGNGDLTWNDSSIGFQIQRNGTNYEIRVQVIDGTPTTTTGSWVSMGNAPNIKVILFALDGDVTLLWSLSNGATRHQIWQEITSTGAPVSNSAGTGLSRVNVELLAGASAGGTAAIDVRSLMVFESDTLPFSRLGY